MRNIVNISLPDIMVEIIKKEVKHGGFASNSEFFRHLIRLWAAQELKEDRIKFEKKQGKVLRSLKDLR